MSDNVKKKSSGIIVTFLIALIVISFMFTGFNSMQSGGASAIGTVGDETINITEYRREYDRTTQYFSSMMGGRSLSKKQIESFGIKDRVLNNLINQKLILNLASILDQSPSKKEVAAQIKELPYFKTNGQFDLKLYKNLLRRNSLTPTEFEKTVIQDLKMQSIRNHFQKVPISKSYLSSLAKYKNNRINSKVINFNKQGLAQFVNIKNSEISTFLKNKDNREKVQKIFDEKKLSFNKPAQIKARHILLKETKDSKVDIAKKIQSIRKQLTPKNFVKLANKYTEDPSGKGKGGSLGWFAKGRMVKEFDSVAFSLKKGEISQPVKTQFGQHIIYVEDIKKAYIATFENHKNSIAKTLIQETKKKEIEQLFSEVSAKVANLIEKKDFKGLKTLSQKYKLKLEENKPFNQLDGYAGSIQLSKEQLKEIFEKYATNPTFLFSTENDALIVYAKKNDKKNENNEKNDKKIRQGQELMLSRTLDKDLIDNLKKKFSVKVKKQFL